MTDMTAVSDMSDTSPEDDPAPISPERVLSARFLARNTAAVLREVADEGHSFAIRHFGRVVGFLVPLDGRVPVNRRGEVVYEVPRPAPLRELDPLQQDILRSLDRRGSAVLDVLVIDCEASARDVVTAVGSMELGEPRLVSRTFGGWLRLTDDGRRHVDALLG